MSSEDEDERRLQDVFIKTNVCWDVTLEEQIDKARVKDTQFLLNKITQEVSTHSATPMWLPQEKLD